MKPITENTVQQLIAAARYGNCSIFLEVTGPGIVMKLTKPTHVPGPFSITRDTQIHTYIDANDPETEHRIQKAFYALP